MDTFLGLAFAVALVAANGFFVVVEFALVASDRAEVEREAKAGSRRAVAMLELLTQMSHHLSGAQFGITATTLLLGFFSQDAIAAALSGPLASAGISASAALPISLAAALVLSTVFQMVVGELVPKGVAIASPMRFGLATALPMKAFDAVFHKLIHFLNESANWTVKRLGMTPVDELSSVRSIEELEMIFTSSSEEGKLEASAAELLTKSIRLRDKTAGDILVPTRDIVALEASAAVGQLARVTLESGYSRFPVYGSDIHDVVGLVHAKDVFRVKGDARATARLGDLVTPMMVVPESRNLESLLSEMRRTAVQMVLVVDEYGSVAGIVTLEDLIEEVVGSIDDEYDIAEDDNHAVATYDGWLRVDAALHAAELHEETGFTLPDGEYTTLGGFLVERLESIPAPGAVHEELGWEFVIDEANDRRVAAVRMRKQPS